MSLLMGGMIDAVFESTDATLTTYAADYLNGILINTQTQFGGYIVNVQPASDKEIEWLKQGGERTVDVRRVYVNDGDFAAIELGAIWEFDALPGQQYKIVKLDNRPWRSYCKCLATALDGQPEPSP